MKITHRPKGNMCLNCKGLVTTELGFLRNDCPTESEFKSMQPIGKDKDGTIVVKCDRYEAEI